VLLAFSLQAKGQQLTIGQAPKTQESVAIEACEAKAKKSNDANATIECLEELRRKDRMAKRCEEATKEFSEAQKAYAESCSKAGYTLSDCYRRASACLESDTKTEKDLAVLDREKDDGEEPDELTFQRTCKERFDKCPALAKVRLADAKERRTDSRSEIKDNEESFFDAQDKIMREQRELMNNQNDKMKEVQDLQTKQQNLRQEVEQLALSRQAKTAEKVQRLRKEYEEIDKEYLRMRTEIRNEQTRLKKEDAEIIARCDREARAASAQRDAKRRKTTGNANAAISERKNRALYIADKRNECLNSISTVAARSALIEQNAVLIQNTMDVQQVMEQRRANIATSLNEAQILEDAAAEQTLKNASEQLKSLNQRHALQVQRGLQDQQAKMQMMQTDQQRFQEKKRRMDEARENQRKAKFDVKCAEFYVERSGSSSSTSLTPSSSDINFGEMLSKRMRRESLFDSMEKVCQEAKLPSGETKPTEEVKATK